jgi:hypothetical protein
MSKVRPPTGKDLLLEWLKNRVNSYEGVHVVNFEKGWGDGLAICALIHSQKADLIDFHSLKKEKQNRKL